MPHCNQQVTGQKTMRPISSASLICRVRRSFLRGFLGGLFLRPASFTSARLARQVRLRYLPDMPELHGVRKARVAFPAKPDLNAGNADLENFCDLCGC